MPLVGRYTVTHRDLALYESCPRLLAAQAYLTIHPERRVKNRPRDAEPVEGLDGLAMGTIGEAMTAEMLGDFDSGVDSRAVTRQALDSLRRRGVALSASLRRQVEAAVRAAQAQFEVVHDALESRYGRLALLGRGKAHYGHVPGFAAPDYVAVAKDGSVILVEAKYQGKLTQDQFRQAEWYNAVATADALQVRWVPQAGERMRGSIHASFRDPQECVLVNWAPGGGGVVPVTARANVNKRILTEMWRVKLLGFKGRVPEHDCGTHCRCRTFMQKHRLELRAGNLAVPRPPVVSVGQAYVEAGLDLEGRGLGALAAQVAGKDLIPNLRELHFLGRWTGRPNQGVDALAELLGIPEDRAREVLFRDKLRGRDRDARVEKAWKPLVGEGLSLQGIKAQVTRTYAAARDVERLVKRSGQFWDKAEG